MQLAPTIFNMHLVRAKQGAAPNVLELRTLEVPFTVKEGHPYGGHVSNTTIVDGKVRGIGIRAFAHRPAERSAAQSVLDAITASGLLTAELPVNDRQRPAPGRSRLYLDRRARFIEFDTAAPPPAVQGVLAALAGYEQIAKQGITAA